METIVTRFKRDHEELLRLFEEVRNAVEGADAPTIQRIWTDFERAVGRHFDAEETIMLPRLERAHPEEVARIRAEHSEIRRLMLELGIRADLRTLRKQAADDLVRKLEEHAAREETGIYAWADEELGEHRASLLERSLVR